MRKVHCTLNERVQDEFELDWGELYTCKLDQYGSLKASRKLAEKCQVKNSMEKMVNVGIGNAASVEDTKG